MKKLADKFKFRSNLLMEPPNGKSICNYWAIWFMKYGSISILKIQHFVIRIGINLPLYLFTVIISGII